MHASFRASIASELSAARHAHVHTRSQSRARSVSLPGERSRRKQKSDNQKSDSSCNGNSTEPTTVETVTGYSSSDDSSSGTDDVPALSPQRYSLPETDDDGPSETDDDGPSETADGLALPPLRPGRKPRSARASRSKDKAPVRPSYNSQTKTAIGLECPSPR